MGRPIALRLPLLSTCLAAGMKIIYEQRRASAPLSPPDKSGGRSRIEGSAPRAFLPPARSVIHLVLKVTGASEDRIITTEERAALHHSQGGDNKSHGEISHLAAAGEQSYFCPGKRRNEA